MQRDQGPEIGDSGDLTAWFQWFQRPSLIVALSVWGSFKPVLLKWGSVCRCLLTFLIVLGVDTGTLQVVARDAVQHLILGKMVLPQT